MITKGGETVKKQVLTKQDIQRELLIKINKSKPLVVFFTVFTAISIPTYIGFVINYSDIMIEYRTGVLAGRGHPTFGLFLVPIAILFLTVFLLNYYYIDLYKAKKGKFIIFEEKLYDRKRELIRYYRRTTQENSLYFRFGRVAVEDDVYSYSTVGDRFYVVRLRARKTPILVYHTKYYETSGN